MTGRQLALTLGPLGLLGLLAWVLLFGGRETALGPLALAGGAVALLPERDRVRQALRAAGERYGLPPEWPEAVGWVESRWRLDAVGDDGESVGPTQIRRATLRRNGYDGDPDLLRQDADLAAEWTARLMVAGARNAEGGVLRETPRTAEDLAAWWNAGRQHFADLPEDHVTRADYAPKLASALGEIAGVA